MDGENEGQDSQVENTGGISQGQQESSADTGINPAWNELLSNVPAGLHSQITPHLTKWDQNFQSKINEVHSQYEPYKPFLENQIQPDQIQYALGIMQAIEERPQEVLQALQAYMGNDTEEQGLPNNDTNGPGNTDVPEFLQHPEVVKMQETLNAVTQILLNERQAATDQEMNQQIDQELAAASEKYGEFDEEWVLTKALNADITIEEAASQYQAFVQDLLSKQQQAKTVPPVLGAGGSVANPDFQPGKMDGKDRRNIVMQMLSNAAQQGN